LQPGAAGGRPGTESWHDSASAAHQQPAPCQHNAAGYQALHHTAGPPLQPQPQSPPPPPQLPSWRQSSYEASLATVAAAQQKWGNTSRRALRGSFCGVV